MKELTNKYILKVLKTAKRLYIDKPYIGMRAAIRESFNMLDDSKPEFDIFHNYDQIIDNIPEFNIHVAFNRFNAYQFPDCWDISDKKPRIKYFNWLIRIYTIKSCKDILLEYFSNKNKLL